MDYVLCTIPFKTDLLFQEPVPMRSELGKSWKTWRYVTLMIQNISSVSAQAKLKQLIATFRFVSEPRLVSRCLRRRFFAFQRCWLKMLATIRKHWSIKRWATMLGTLTLAWTSRMVVSSFQLLLESTMSTLLKSNWLMPGKLILSNYNLMW